MALSVLAIAAVSLVEVVLQAQHAVNDVSQRTSEMLQANSFLESVALWPRADLDLHLGRRREGSFDLIIERMSPTLYHVALARHEGVAERQLLSTILPREVP